MCSIRLKSDFQFPSILYPKYDPDYLCEHNYSFKEDDRLMRVCAPQIVLYEDTKETIYNTEVMYRDSNGPCKCRHHYDGHEYLVFHMGSG